MTSAVLELLRLPRETPVALGRDGDVTARDLLALAEGLAHALPAVGDEGVQDVAIVCADRYHLAAALLGVWLAGHRVALPANDRLETLQALRERTPLVAVVGDGQAGADIDLRGIPPRQSQRESLGFSAAKPAVCLYTSGTTGLPQPHAKTFGQLLGEAQVLGTLFDFHNRRVLATVPSHHIYGLLAGVLAPLMAGGSFVRETPLHPAQIMDAAGFFQADTLVAAPANLKALVCWPHVRQARDGHEGASLRTVFSSGAALPADVATQLQALWNLSVTELLGSTETGAMGHRKAPQSSAWTPLPGVVLSTAQALEMPDLDPKQLLLRSPFVALDDWYVTNDIGQVCPDGKFQHHGRVDHVVKVGGRRVHLVALENRIRNLPGVHDVAMLALPAPPPRDVELACVLVAPGVSVDRIRASLLQVFDPVALPRRWRFVTALPREPNGKLPRARLLALFEGDGLEHGMDVACETRACSSAADGSNHCFTIAVPSDAWFFEGHFEGDPLMPGVVQVNDLVLEHAALVFPDLLHLQQVSRLKFKHPIRPADVLTLRLCRTQEAQSLSFALHVGEVECSSGVLEFARSPA